MDIQILHIASNHVDFMCRNCCTAFELKINQYIKCPNCKPNLTKETERILKKYSDENRELRDTIQSIKKTILKTHHTQKGERQ